MQPQQQAPIKMKRLCLRFIHKTFLIKDSILKSSEGYDVVPGGENLIALEVFIRNQKKQGELKKLLTNLRV